MEAESMNDKYSVKNLLFYRAIPPYVIPEPIIGYKLYSCTDCGDRFVFESSYQDHINRRSVKITYTCRRCPRALVFYNRCNLLSHIRSHSFKTATINVSDLKIEPVPLSFFKISDTPKDASATVTAIVNATTTATAIVTATTTATTTASVSKIATQGPPIAPLENTTRRTPIFCIECNVNITSKGSAMHDRVAHYMKYTNKFYSCPVCLLTLPTICALKSHLRIHLKSPPYFCPECGAQLPDRIINYPFYHNCEGFNMMRATVRLQCPIDKCRENLFHPTDFKKHLKSEHMKKVYKCPNCVVACFSATTINKHLAVHQNQQMANLINNIMIFYQCEMCPGRLVLQSHLEGHMNTHINEDIYPCWTCGIRFKEISLLIDHHINTHAETKEIKNTLRMALNDKESSRRIYRVVKRCDHCLRSFTYKCKYDDIKVLPNACPYKCTSKSKSKKNKRTNTKIKCPLCDYKVEQNWEVVKKHFALHHKNHKCLDAKVSLSKIDTKTRRKRIRFRRCDVSATKNRRIRKKVIKQEIMKPTDGNEMSVLKSAMPNSQFMCVKCRHDCQSKEELEIHIKDHRDPCMAYQCMECAECFVVKPSFTTHLLVEHGIINVDEYIRTKQCYNDDAMITNVQRDIVPEIPLSDNQCNICRESFDDSEELEKHYRVHGMAFLIKNSQSKPVNI